MDGESVQILKRWCKDPRTVESVQIFRRECRDSRTVKSVRISKGECRNPRTADLVRLFFYSRFGPILETNAGTHGPSIRSEFIKGDGGIHGRRISPILKRGCKDQRSSKRSKIFIGNSGIHRPPFWSECLEGMQRPMNDRFSPNLTQVMQRFTNRVSVIKIVFTGFLLPKNWDQKQEHIEFVHFNCIEKDWWKLKKCKMNFSYNNSSFIKNNE